MFIYGNWSAYDELSDGVELTEELAMRQLQELLRLREQGVRFDTYLMDAFWYAADGGYRSWRKPHWPDGPDRWVDACTKHGLLPGLWFTVNTLCHIEPAPAWIDSVSANQWGICMFSGGFLEDYFEVLTHWHEKGIRIFKLDFADFTAVPAGTEGTIDPAEARTRNVRAFRESLLSFRSQHPEAIFMAFNGFEDAPCMDRTDRPLGHIIDPAWLDCFDSVYSGDPRPSDVPCGSFWRSVDIYADHMVRAFEASGIPLERIDNCGFMAGPTGTCYWRGKGAWKGMLLLSLARGGRIHVAYGDLSQFSDDDAKWWANAQKIFAPIMEEGSTRSIGGIPGKGEPYGWLGQHAATKIIVAVNPGLEPEPLGLPEGDWKLGIHDPGFVPVLGNSGLTLAGGQVAMFSELKNSETRHVAPEPEPLPGTTLTPAPTPLDSTSGDSLGSNACIPNVTDPGLASLSVLDHGKARKRADDSSPSSEDKMASVSAEQLRWAQAEDASIVRPGGCPALDEPIDLGTGPVAWECLAETNRIEIPEHLSGPRRIFLQRFAEDGPVVRTYPGEDESGVPQFASNQPFKVLESMPTRKVWSGMSWTAADTEIPGGHRTWVGLKDTQPDERVRVTIVPRPSG